MIDDMIEGDREAALEKITDLMLRFENITAELDALYDVIAGHRVKPDEPA
ncbi:MAG: hypothetical protein AAFX39_12020 [Pseudomonadota bacterium]